VKGKQTIFILGHFAVFNKYLIHCCLRLMTF